MRGNEAVIFILHLKFAEKRAGFFFLENSGNQENHALHMHPKNV